MSDDIFTNTDSDYYISNEKLKRARSHFFRLSTKLRLFGLLATKFEWEVHKFDKEDIQGYITYNIDNPSDISDGTIHLNIDIVKENDYKCEHCATVVMHELLHILKKHACRRGLRDMLLWNLACDHVINREIKTFPHESGLKFYKDNFFFVEQIEEEHKNCSEEKAYNWLDKHKEEFTFTMNSDGTVTVSNGKESWTISPDKESHNQGQNDKMSKYVDKFFAQASSLYNFMKKKGDCGGSMSSYLDKLLKITIPWETILEKAIKTNVSIKMESRSWKSINKYYHPHGITLPGQILTEDQGDGIGRLLVLIDSSGSMPEDDLKKAIGVIEQSMKFFNTIECIVHDVDIQQHEEFNSANVNELYEFARNGIKGRGGTSHRPSFNYIEDKWINDREWRDELSIVISITDGQSDLENNTECYKWLRSNTPLVLLVFGNWTHKFNLKNIIVINIENKNE